MPFGWDPSGLNTANKQLSVGTGNFTFSFMHPYNYLSPAFVGQRGSMQLTVNVQGLSEVSHIRIYRQPNVSGDNFSQSATQVAVGSGSSAARFYVNNLDNGAAGQALTNQNTNSGLTVQMPNYTQYKFQTTDPTAIVTNPTRTGNDIDAHVIETSFTPASPYVGAPGQTNIFSKQWRYYGVGTDFNLHWLLNVPTYWNYASLLTAV